MFKIYTTAALLAAACILAPMTSASAAPVNLATNDAVSGNVVNVRGGHGHGGGGHGHGGGGHGHGGGGHGHGGGGHHHGGGGHHGHGHHHHGHHHHHHRGHHHHRRHYGYYSNYYSGGSCSWLRRRALRTGSGYWWRRYEDCLYDY